MADPSQWGAVPLQKQQQPASGPAAWGAQPLGGNVATGTPGKVEPTQTEAGSSILRGMHVPIEEGKLLGAKVFGTPEQAQQIQDRITQSQQKFEAQGGSPFLSSVGSAITTSPLMATGFGGLPGAAAGGAISGVFSTPSSGQDYVGEKAQAATMGGILAPLTGGAGRVASRFGEIASPEARTLADAGVRLAPYQRAGKAESALAEVPVTRQFVRGAEQRSVEDWQRATYNKALEPIGQNLNRGTPVAKALNEAASKLDLQTNRVSSKLNFKHDGFFNTQVYDLRANEPNDVKKALIDVEGKYLNPLLLGMGSGAEYNRAYQEIGNLAARSSGRLQEKLYELQGIMRQSLAKQNPQAFVQLQKIEQSYDMLNRIRQTDKTGVFMPDALAPNVQGSQLENLTSAAQAVLPQKLKPPRWGEEVKIGIGGAVPTLALGPMAAHTVMDNPGMAGAAAAATALPTIPYTRAGIAAARSMENVPPWARSIVRRGSYPAGVGAVPVEKSALEQGYQQLQYGGPQE